MAVDSGIDDELQAMMAEYLMLRAKSRHLAREIVQRFVRNESELVETLGDNYFIMLKLAKQELDKPKIDLSGQENGDNAP